MNYIEHMDLGFCHLSIHQQNYLQHSDHFSRILTEMSESKVKNNNSEMQNNNKSSPQTENNISNLEEKK